MGQFLGVPPGYHDMRVSGCIGLINNVMQKGPNINESMDEFPIYV
jgi:hypothetical protein